MSIVAIVLAADGARPVGRGRHPLENVVEEVQASRCDQIGVVLGATAADLAPVLAGRGVTLVLNGAWSEGVATSIRAGMHWAARTDAVLICTWDQELCASYVDSLIAAHLETGLTVASRCRGALGLPAVFGRDTFSQLVALEGHAEPLSVINGDVVAIEWPEGAASEVA